MAESRYGKYIKLGAKATTPVPGTLWAAAASLENPDDWQGIQHRINWNYVSQPAVMENEPHSHDFDEFLCFIGSNPADKKELGAEIEISMGKEGEKQVIDTPTVVCIPKGMVHCPINFRKVDKPVLYCNIYMSPEYVKKHA